MLGVATELLSHIVTPTLHDMLLRLLADGLQMNIMFASIQFAVASWQSDLGPPEPDHPVEPGGGEQAGGGRVELGAVHVAGVEQAAVQAAVPGYSPHHSAGLNISQKSCFSSPPYLQSPTAATRRPSPACSWYTRPASSAT